MKTIALIPTSGKDCGGRTIIYDAVLNGEIIDTGGQSYLKQKYKNKYYFRLYPSWESYNDETK